MKTREQKKATRTHEAKPRQPRAKVAVDGSLTSRFTHPQLAPVASDAPTNVSGRKVEEEHAAAEFERTIALIGESRERAQRTQAEIDRLKRQTRAILDKLLINL